MWWAASIHWISNALHALCESAQHVDKAWQVRQRKTHPCGHSMDDL